MSRILRLPEVIKRSGLSKSSIYTFMETSQFPKSVSLGMRSVGWLETEINDWINQRVINSKIGA